VQSLSNHIWTTVQNNCKTFQTTGTKRFKPQVQNLSNHRCTTFQTKGAKVSNHRCKTFQTTGAQLFKPQVQNVSNHRSKTLQHCWSSPVVKATVKQLKVATLKNTQNTDAENHARVECERDGVYFNNIFYYFWRSRVAKNTARLGSLKMVSADSETLSSANRYVVGYTQCREWELANKWRYGHEARCGRH